MNDWERAWYKEIKYSEAAESLQKLEHAIKVMQEAEEKLKRLVGMLQNDARGKAE